MGKYSRLGKNTILVFLGNAGAKLIGLIMLPFYTRWLSVEDYGLTDVLGVYVSLLIGVVSCCIGESLFIYPKKVDNRQKEQYFSTGILFIIGMMFIAAIFFLLFQHYGSIYKVHNSFFDNIWLIYSMIACMLLQQTIQQFTRSLDKMVVYSITGIVVTVCTAIYSFLLIPHYGVYGYVASMNLAYLSGALYSFLASGSYNLFHLCTFSKEKCMEMLRYSVPLIPNGIMWWLVSALNRPILEMNTGLYGIGIFAVANKISGIVTTLFTIFCSSWQISVIEEYGKEGFSKFYNGIFRVVIGAVFLVFFIMTMFSRFLVTIATSSDYFEAWHYIPVLVLGAVSSSISAMGGTVYSAVKKSKYYFYSSFWGAIVAIFFNIILIPLIGVLGASISVVLSFTAMAVSRIYYAWQYVHIEKMIKYIEMYIISILSVIIVFIFTPLTALTLNIMLIGILFLINIDLRFELMKLCNKFGK